MGRQFEVNGFSLCCAIDWLHFVLFSRSRFSFHVWFDKRRHIEEMFTLELNKSDEKIVKLTSEISSLQVIFRLLSDYMDAFTMQFHTTEKIERGNQHQREGDAASCRFENWRNEGWNQISHGCDWVSSERLPLKSNRYSTQLVSVGTLTRSNRETRNHNLIDDMHKKLAQTNKKLNDVKRKCTTTAKQCLQVQLENVSEKFFLLERGHVKKLNQLFHGNIFHFSALDEFPSI